MIISVHIVGIDVTYEIHTFVYKQVFIQTSIFFIKKHSNLLTSNVISYYLTKIIKTVYEMYHYDNWSLFISRYKHLSEHMDNWYAWIIPVVYYGII